MATQSIPELPDLSPAVQLLDTEASGAFPALVADHVLYGGKWALWVDAGRQARTRRLADVAPTMEPICDGNTRC